MQKHFSMKKRFTSLLLSTAMVSSVLLGTTFTEKTNAAEQTTTDEFSQFATGDLTPANTSVERLISNSEYAVAEEEFDEVIADDVEEYQERLGINNDETDSDDEANMDTDNTDADTDSDYPSSVDLSTSKYFPAIGNQKSIGSCVCFAEVYYAFTYERCKALDIEATGDNIMSPAFVYNHIKVPTGGTYYDAALENLSKVGAPSKNTADFESYSSEAACKTWFPEKDIWEEASENRIASYTYINNPSTISSIDDEDLESFKKYLSEGYLITFSSKVLGWNYTTIPSGSSHSGEYIVKSASSASGGHRMTIVGYDDNIYCDLNGNGTIENSERGAFKIANSWGTSYKNNGYIWVSYDSMNYTSAASVTNSNRIRSMYSFAVRSVDSESKASNVNLVTTLNTANRKYARIYITGTDANGNTRSAYTYPLFGYNYLEYALDGNTSSTSGTITYDLNNLFGDSITEENVDEYTWSVTIYDNYNDDYTVTLEDAYIETSKNIIYDVTIDNTSINNSSKSYKFKEAALRADGFEVSDDAPGITDTVTLSASAKGGSGNYTYTYGAIHDGTTYVFPYCENTTSSSVSVKLSYPDTQFYAGSAVLVGNNTLYVDITDTETNETIRQTIEDYEVEGLKITSFTATTDSGRYVVGEPVDLAVTVENEATYRYNPRVFSYTHNGVTTTLTVDSSSTGYSDSFTPTETGTYDITYTISDYIGQSATSTISITVVPENSIATIYYNNSSWSDANIHYCVDNGSWTSVPGVAMEESDIDGYTWKYEIDLGTESGVQVCFNNGNNWWDSQNGANYYVTAGTYGIKDGTVTELDLEFTATLTADQEVGGKYNTSSFTVETANGTPASYTYYIYPAGSTKSVGYGTTNSTYNFYNWTPYTAGTYTIEVEVKDTNGNVATDVINNYVVEGEMFDYFTTSVASPQNVNTAITLSASFKNFQPDPYNSYSFTVNNGTTTKSLDTSVSNNVATATWTPTEAGTYTLTAIFRSFNGVSTSTSIQYVVKNSNTVTVYYNNSSWSNANIHYCVNNGSWTNVPGVAMTSSNRGGYKWMYTIDLGTQSGAQVCFNNGNNWWDSRNGANYYVTAGTYGISNGNVTSLS